MHAPPPESPGPHPVAFMHHCDCARHDTGPGHPERAERLTAIDRAIVGYPVSQHLRFLRPEPADHCWIEAIHTPDYHRYIEETCLSGKGFADTGDTHISPDSYRAACLAAGAALRAVDEVLTGRAAAAFSAARPPGHHARTEAAMGFCLFNNIAIAARYAQLEYGIRRVFILDWDVHHGNGTQEAFYAEPSVFFCSFHQHPHYPGTGAAWETGTGNAKGTTLNIPLPAGSIRSDYQSAFESRVQPALDAFAPELILISAGFDAHRDDPLGGVLLEDEDFGAMTRWLLESAHRHCGGRIVSILEGGYNLDALGRSVRTHLEALVAGAE